jgi:pimeloyl-ACP methyl ester carboxylesterase
MGVLSGERLVFLPGLDGTGISYEPLGCFIAPDAAVTVVRYPTGKTQSFEEMVDCAAEQMRTAEGAVVVAESFSGPIAVTLTGSGRIRPKCLVLCATFARSPRPLLMRVGGHLPLAAMMGLASAEGMLRWALGGAETAASLGPMWSRIAAVVDPEVLAHRINIAGHLDVREWLPKLAVPCLYLQATEDLLVPASAVDDFVQSVPRLSVKRIDGPHFILQARPGECAAAIDEFSRAAAVGGRRG